MLKTPVTPLLYIRHVRDTHRICELLTFFKITHFSKTRVFQNPAIFQNHAFFKITRFNAIKRGKTFLFHVKIMATNTLGEFSDGEDDFVFEIDENLWNNDEDDDLIRNIDENEVLAGTVWE